MMKDNSNELVQRETWDTDLKYAGSKTVPLCRQFWVTYRIEDLVSNILMDNGNQIFNDDWQIKNRLIYNRYRKSMRISYALTGDRLSSGKPYSRVISWDIREKNMRIWTVFLRTARRSS